MRSALQGVLLGTCCACLALAPARAWSQDEGLPAWYVGPLLGYVFTDSFRDADYGFNVHVVNGYLLAEALAVEVNGFAQQNRRLSDGRRDYAYGGGLDLALGLPAPANPFFLLGGGYIGEDLLQVRYNSGYANIGLGMYLPFQWDTELWRVEARYNAIFNDQAYPGREMLEDVRVNVGVLFGFGEYLPPAEPVETLPEPEPEPAPPAPTLAVGDEDSDGVPDDRDRCPGTPRWVRADANGCVPDSDGDGVDETKDCCPATPAGAPVDVQGCEPAPPVAPVPSGLLPAAPAGDEDRDGVPDGTDRCPHTAPGLKVDATGCVVVGSVVLTDVHFQFDSDVLTEEAYRILNSVAAAIRAHGGKVEVAGHADGMGSPKYNMELSQRRASVVYDFLTYLGIDSQNLAVKAYGETRPKASNQTEEGRAMNRRVEFTPQ